VNASESSVVLEMISPNTKLSNAQCDFVEGLWEGKPTIKLLITNWSGELLSIESGTEVGEKY